MSPIFSGLFRGEKVKGIVQESISPAAYQLDYCAAIAAVSREQGGVKEISWGRFQNIPLYKVRTENGIYTIDASSDTVRPFYVTEEMIYSAVKKLAGDTIRYTITKMDEYDNYYISRKKGRLPPPWGQYASQKKTDF